MIHLAAGLVMDLMRIVMGLMTAGALFVGVYYTPVMFRYRRMLREERERAEGAKALAAAELLERQRQQQELAQDFAAFDAQLQPEHYALLHPPPAQKMASHFGMRESQAYLQSEMQQAAQLANMQSPVNGLTSAQLANMPIPLHGLAGTQQCSPDVLLQQQSAAHQYPFTQAGLLQQFGLQSGNPEGDGQ